MLLKKIFRKLIGNMFAILGILVSFCVDAEEKKHIEFNSFGAGNTSCGNYVKTYSEQIEKPEYFVQYSQWVRGFVSAYNFFVASNHDITNGTDFEGIFLWLNNYCNKMPLETFSQATIYLINDLTVRQK